MNNDRTAPRGEMSRKTNQKCKLTEHGSEPAQYARGHSLDCFEKRSTFDRVVSRLGMENKDCFVFHLYGFVAIDHTKKSLRKIQQHFITSYRHQTKKLSKLRKGTFI